MNKRDFINKIKEVTGFSDEKATLVNDVLENHFIIGRHGKEQIINELIERLSVSREEADKIYNTCMEVITTGIKDKIIHPFKTND